MNCVVQLLEMIAECCRIRRPACAAQNSRPRRPPPPRSPATTSSESAAVQTQSSTAYTIRVTPRAATPMIAPSNDVERQRRQLRRVRNRASAKTGSRPSKTTRMPAAARCASATGIIDRGRNSNSSSSIANSTADTGLPNVAAMPAAAPAASSVLRSLGVVCRICPMSDPNAPPVAMIGPSAPNGPPVPIEIAAESGLRNVEPRRDAAVVGQHLLHRLGNAMPANGFGTVSASNPMTTAPAIGTAITHNPRWLSAGPTKSNEKRP